MAVAASLLLAWRFGRAAMRAAARCSRRGGHWQAVRGRRPSLPLWFTAWVPLASLCGVWMGWREEGGGPSSGERAWMFVPLLLLASSLPLLPGFPAAVARLDARMRVEQERMLASMKPDEVPAALREAMRQASSAAGGGAAEVADVDDSQRDVRCGWCCSRRPVARSPRASRACWAGRRCRAVRCVAWRLPDAALVPLIVGIALLVFADRALHPSALTLLLHVVLGYSVQGVAVVESVLLSRGMSPAFVALTMLFVIAVSLLWVLPAVAVVGLSDVWLDYRRLEPSSDRRGVGEKRWKSS